MNTKILKKCLKPRSILPVLDCFMFHDGKVSATNMDVRVTQHHEYILPDRMALNGCIHGATISKLDEIGIGSISNIDNDKVLVECKWGVQAKIKSIPNSDYVGKPTIDSSKSTKAYIWRKHMIRWLENTVSTIMAKNFSPVLTGVNIVISSNGSLEFTGTDSFRLANYYIEGRGVNNTNSLNIIVPKNSAEILLDMLRDCDSYENNDAVFVEINESGNMACFICAEQELLTILIQGKYPEWRNENIVPSTYDKKYTYDLKNLRSKVNTLYSATRKQPTTDLYVVWYEHTIFTDLDCDEDNYMVRLDYDTNLPDQDIELFGVNLKYIKPYLWLPFLRDKEFITIGYNGKDKPLVFRDDSNYDDCIFTYVVRPLIR